MQAVSGCRLSKADGSCMATVVDVTSTAGLRGLDGYTIRACVFKLDCFTCLGFTLASGWGFDSAWQRVIAMWSIIPDRRRMWVAAMAAGRDYLRVAAYSEVMALLACLLTLLAVTAQALLNII